MSFSVLKSPAVLREALWIQSCQLALQPKPRCPQMSPSGIPQRPCTIVRKQLSCGFNPALNPWPVWGLITSPELDWGMEKLRERCFCWSGLYLGHKWLGSNLLSFLPLNFCGCNNVKLLVDGHWFSSSWKAQRLMKRTLSRQIIGLLILLFCWRHWHSITHFFLEL